MADHDLWRKNLPADFEGRMGDEWDDEIEIKPVIWSAVAVAVSVAVAFVFCAWMISSLESLREKPVLSPIAEANERRLPPTPWLQPRPEVELDHMREELEHHLTSFGWNDELDGVAHIPVERAMAMVLAHNSGTAAAMETDAVVLDHANDNDSHGEAAGDDHDAEPAQTAGAAGH